MNHVDTVRQMYAAFGRADVAAIVEKMDPEVEWEYGQAENPVPWLARRRGRHGVVAFFEALGRGVTFSRFEPHRFFADGNMVVVLVNVTLTVTATGKTFSEDDEVHIWTFGENGLARRFAHRADTHQHAEALRP